MKGNEKSCLDSTMHSKRGYYSMCGFTHTHIDEIRPIQNTQNIFWLHPKYILTFTVCWPSCFLPNNVLNNLWEDLLPCCSISNHKIFEKKNRNEKKFKKINISLFSINKKWLLLWEQKLCFFVWVVFPAQFPQKWSANTTKTRDGKDLRERILEAWFLIPVKVFECLRQYTFYLFPGPEQKESFNRMFFIR